MASLKHKKVSGKADGGDSTFVRPSDWNDEHDLNLSSAGRYMGRDRTGAGPVQELPVSDNGAGDDGTIWTAAKVAAAIAAAIAAIPAPPVGVPVGATLGWYSVNAPAGFLFSNGQTIGSAASGANYADPLYLALFTYLWTNLTDTTSPILTSAGAASTRGATAQADFDANKRITLPDECGRTSAGSNVMGGITSKARITTAASGFDGDVLGAAGGAQTHTLSFAEMPYHAHYAFFFNGGAGVSGGGNAAQAGGSGDPTSAAGGNAPHRNVQPTIIKNVIIKY